MHVSFEERLEGLGAALLERLEMPGDTPLPSGADLGASMGEPWMQEGIEELSGRTVAAMEACMMLHAAAVCESVAVWPAEQRVVWMALEARVAMNPTVIPETNPSPAGALRALHDLWEMALVVEPDLKHPVAPTIKAWLQRPEQIRPAVDKGGRPRRNGILPAGLFPNPPASVAAQLKLIPSDQLPALGRIEPEPASLPLFADMMDEEDLPVTPLILANAAGFRGLQPGTGARYDKRIMIFSLLSMPLDQRRPGGRYEWRPKLRELRDLLFPPRPRRGRRPGAMTSSYRPRKHAWPLVDAMSAVNLAEIRLPDGYHWRPVIVRGYPDFHDLDSEVIVEIRLPEGSDRGPLVDRLALAEAGALSDPAFDLELGLAYLWDEAKMRNGGYRIYATRPEAVRNEEGYVVDAADQVIIERGRPSTRWNHPSAVLTGREERNPQADKVRVLTREDRRKLAYGPGRVLPGMPIEDTKNKSQKGNERRGADDRLAQLKAGGRIVIEKDVVDPRTGKKGWRILETRRLG